MSLAGLWKVFPELRLTAFTQGLLFAAFNRRIVLGGQMLAVKGMLQKEAAVVHLIAKEIIDLSILLADVGNRFLQGVDTEPQDFRSEHLLVKSRNFYGLIPHQSLCYPGKSCLPRSLGEDGRADHKFVGLVLFYESGDSTRYDICRSCKRIT